MCLRLPGMGSWTDKSSISGMLFKCFVIFLKPTNTCLLSQLNPFGFICSPASLGVFALQALSWHRHTTLEYRSEMRIRKPRLDKWSGSQDHIADDFPVQTLVVHQSNNLRSYFVIVMSIFDGIKHLTNTLSVVLVRCRCLQDLLVLQGTTKSTRKKSQEGSNKNWYISVPNTTRE